MRKLEFLLAEAVNNDATHVITCGGPQSNHVRATVFAARQLGLGVTAIIRKPAAGDIPENGNLLLTQILDASIEWLDYNDYQNAGGSYTPFLLESEKKLNQSGKKTYVIPEGGSSALGSWGYISACDELEAAHSNGIKPFDHIFCALGSGGTVAGLVLGYAQKNWPVSSICAVNVCDSEDYFRNRISQIMSDFAENWQLPSSQINEYKIFDGHFGSGYGQATKDDLLFYKDLAKKEGVLLDPVYTGKAFRGMLHEIKKHPSHFGENILFLHSGGWFANFAYEPMWRDLLSR